MNRIWSIFISYLKVFNYIAHVFAERADTLTVFLLLSVLLKIFLI